MTGDMTSRVPIRPSPLEAALDWLQRGVAMVSLVQGITYWVRLLGFFEGAEWRFDLMPYYWQATAVPLAVLFPLAAVGLWMLASWGPVIWFMCAVAEGVMYGILPHLYGHRPWLLILYGLVAAAYAALRGLIYLDRRRGAD